MLKVELQYTVGSVSRYKLVDGAGFDFACDMSKSDATLAAALWNNVEDAHQEAARRFWPGFVAKAPTEWINGGPYEPVTTKPFPPDYYAKGDISNTESGLEGFFEYLAKFRPDWKQYSATRLGHLVQTYNAGFEAGRRSK